MPLPHRSVMFVKNNTVLIELGWMQHHGHHFDLSYCIHPLFSLILYTYYLSCKLFNTYVIFFEFTEKIVNSRTKKVLGYYSQISDISIMNMYFLRLVCKIHLRGRDSSPLRQTMFFNQT